METSDTDRKSHDRNTIKFHKYIIPSPHHILSLKIGLNPFFASWSTYMPMMPYNTHDSTINFVEELRNN